MSKESVKLAKEDASDWNSAGFRTLKILDADSIVSSVRFSTEIYFDSPSSTSQIFISFLVKF
jgi:hypothetical protein